MGPPADWLQFAHAANGGVILDRTPQSVQSQRSHAFLPVASSPAGVHFLFFLAGKAIRVKHPSGCGRPPGRCLLHEPA